MKPVQATHTDPAYGPTPTWVHRVGKKPGTLIVGTKSGAEVMEVPANSVKFKFGPDSKLFGIPYTDPYAVQERVLREVDEESIFTDTSPGRVPVDPQDLEAAEASMTVQESRRLKEYAGGVTMAIVKRMPQYQEFLNFVTTRDLPGIHPDDVRTRWETMFGPMDRKLLSPIIDALEMDGALDKPVTYESKESSHMKKFPFTQTQLDENKVMRYFSKDLTDGELTWHRDRKNRVVRMVEGKGWYLQLDGKLPKPMHLGEAYQIPAGSWHRLIRRPDSSNLTVIVEKAKKGDQVTYKGKKATVKVPDARGPFVGIDPAGPDDMKMVPGDELDEPKKGKKNESARLEGLLDEALNDLLSDVLQEKKGKKKGLWANIHAKRKRGERPAKPGDKGYPGPGALKAARGD